MEVSLYCAPDVLDLWEVGGGRSRQKMGSTIGIGEIIDLTRGFMLSRVILSAHELGVFDVLAEGGKTASEVADAVGASQRGIRRLLNAFAGLGIAVKHSSDTN